MYDELLRGSDVVRPSPAAGHVYHLYVVRSAARNALRTHLQEAGIGTQVHYPTPVHRQAAYREGARAGGRLETTERLAGEILSLPAYPGLSAAAQGVVAEAVLSFGGP
jgi:dTDP-4-amino-4,6-dideoxygalactose transaminase